MKKLLVTFLALCAFVAAFSFAGCEDDGRTPAENKIENGFSICYAFTASGDETAISDDTSVYDYMLALKDNGKLEFDGYDSEYGYFVTSVFGKGGLAVSSTANSYAGYDWAVYTTVTTVDGVTYSSDNSTFNYNGVILYKASYGVSGIPCIEGETYALIYEYSEMSW